jgi:hypothetical protein
VSQYNDTTLGEALLRVYATGRVEQYQNLLSPLIGSIGKSKNHTIGGDGFRFGANVQTDASFGFIAEDAALPPAETVTIKQLVLDPVVFAGQIQGTGLAKAISTNNAHAFVNMIQYAIDQKMKVMTAYKESALFRTGTGRIGLVNGAVSATTTVNVDTGNVMWAKAGMKLRVINGSNVIQSAVGGDTVAEVQYDTSRLIMAAAASYDDNATIFMQNTGQTSATAPVERECFGIPYFVKTSGTTLGLAIASWPTLKSNVIAAAGVAITEDMLLQAENRVIVVGGMSPTEVRDFRWIWHPNQRRLYFRLVQAQKQFSGLNLDAGYAKLTWNGHEMMETYNCPETSIWGGNWSMFEHFVAPGGEMQLDQSFGPVLKWQQGYDAFTAYIRSYDNYAIRQPNAFVEINNLANVAAR